MAKRGLGGVKTKTGNKDSLRFEEVIDLFKFNANPDEWIHLRFLEPDVLPVKRHWIRIIAGKTKKLVTIPRFCLKFNPEDEDSPKDVGCPYCEISTEGGNDAPMRNEFFCLVNAIVRDVQEDEPARKGEPTKSERKTGYKDIKSKAWTPVKVIRLTNGMVARLQELGETNVVKNKKKGTKKAYDVTHPKFGIDINIKYKPKAPGTDKYSIDKSEDGRTPLTEEEAAYLIWNIDEPLLDICGRESEEQAEAEFKKMDIIGGDEMESGGNDYDDDDDDGIDLSSSKKKKPAKLDDDDDEDEPPRLSEKKKKKKKKKSSDDDDAPKTKKKKKKSSDDDDAPKKKKKKKKKAVDWDDN
jgi:hypothetical protein